MTYRIGLDVGSTTAKIVVTDQHNRIVFSDYRRHQANVSAVVKDYFGRLAAELGECRASLTVTGSVGMGLAEKCGVPFVQEVVAAARLVETDRKSVV